MSHLTTYLPQHLAILHDRLHQSWESSRALVQSARRRIEAGRMLTALQTAALIDELADFSRICGEASGSAAIARAYAAHQPERTRAVVLAAVGRLDEALGQIEQAGGCSDHGALVANLIQGRL
jgi:pimeloyl-ACP methyl ester carboxylesterase